MCHEWKRAGKLNEILMKCEKSERRKCKRKLQKKKKRKTFTILHVITSVL